MVMCAWRAAAILTLPCMLQHSCHCFPQSRAPNAVCCRLCSATREIDGDVEWEIEAPITFSYRVRESKDVLDPSSDTLLFGHLTDAR